MEENEQKQIYQIIYKIRYVAKHFTKYDCTATHDGLQLQLSNPPELLK